MGTYTFNRAFGIADDPGRGSAIFLHCPGSQKPYTGGFIQKNLNANKAIWIEREIEKRPVLAFGNSGSDTSMMNYTLDERNPYPSAACMVVEFKAGLPVKIDV